MMLLSLVGTDTSVCQKQRLNISAVNLLQYFNMKTCVLCQDLLRAPRSCLLSSKWLSVPLKDLIYLIFQLRVGIWWWFGVFEAFFLYKHCRKGQWLSETTKEWAELNYKDKICRTWCIVALYLLPVCVLVLPCNKKTKNGESSSLTGRMQGISSFFLDLTVQVRWGYNATLHADCLIYLFSLNVVSGDFFPYSLTSQWKKYLH